MKLPRWVVRAGRLARFVGVFLAQLVSANLLVARSVVFGNPPIRPAIVRYPLETRSEGPIVLLANLISLTPGTLTVDVDEDERHLWVHGLHVTTADSLRAHIAELEKSLLEALR